MKNVVLFANSTWCLYNFRLNLMRTLVSEGCRVYAFAPLDPTYDNRTFLGEFARLGVQFQEIPFQPLGKNPLRELKCIWELLKALRRVKADTVLSYTVKCNLYAGFCRQILGFGQIANVPGLGEVFEKRNLLSFVVSLLYRVAFRGMTHVFFQNLEDLQDCIGRRLVQADRCSVLPGSGIDLSRFRPKPLPLKRGKRVFLMFGRLLRQKGYLEYVEAARQVKSILGEGVEFLVMGIEDKNRVESGDLREKLKEAAEDGIISLLPSRVDVVPTLSGVDAVVLPSRYNEGIPRSLLEGLASGKVIVTTDWRGCRETVDSGKNGLLVQVNSIEGLVQAMLKVAELSESQIRSMGAHSRVLAERNFDEKLVIDEYLSAALGEGYRRRESFATESLSSQRAADPEQAILRAANQS